MKSPMVEAAEYLIIDEKSKYSDLQVLRSAAGYYVGTTYDEHEPGSRDSDYFPDRISAELHLRAIERGEAKTRMTP